MKMTKLTSVLMIRDGITFEEAEEVRKQMRMDVMEGEDPEEVLYEYGLEPDYVFDIL